MSRRRRNPPQESRWTDNPWVRRGISVLLLFHLTAVFVPPFEVGSERGREPSALALTLFESLFPYIQAAHLNHGYQFFAPDPGPTHLVDYVVEFDDGRDSIKGRFPNHDDHWPRLYYHRHMMLSERLNAEGPPPPVNMSPREWQASWPRRRDLDAVDPQQSTPEERLATDFANHLLHRFDGQRVTLTVVRHLIPDREDVLQGATLDEDESYVYPVEFVKVRK